MRATARSSTASAPTASHRVASGPRPGTGPLPRPRGERAVAGAIGSGSNRSSPSSPGSSSACGSGAAAGAGQARDGTRAGSARPWSRARAAPSAARALRGLAAHALELPAGLGQRRLQRVALGLQPAAVGQTGGQGVGRRRVGVGLRGRPLGGEELGGQLVAVGRRLAGGPELRRERVDLGAVLVLELLAARLVGLALLVAGRAQEPLALLAGGLGGRRGPGRRGREPRAQVLDLGRVPVAVGGELRGVRVVLGPALGRMALGHGLGLRGVPLQLGRVALGPGLGGGGTAPGLLARLGEVRPQRLHLGRQPRGLGGPPLGRVEAPA